VAFEIEIAGKEHNLDRVLHLMGKLEQEFDRFKSVLSDSGWIQIPTN